MWEGEEECDDGNLMDGDGCTSGCMNEICGDEIVQPGEDCDDGNDDNTDGCMVNCLPSCVEPETINEDDP